MKNKESEKRVSTGMYVRTWKSGKHTIRIEFCYRKKLCRETLNLEPTDRNIKKAITLRKKIVESIALNKFNYAVFFSYSKRAVWFGHVPKPVFIKELLDQFLKKSKKSLAFSTYARYKRVCNVHLYPTFGDLPITELSAGKIWGWLERFKCQRKTLMNVLTPLRAVVSEVLIYGHIDQDPFRLIDLKRLRKIKSTYVVNPFNQQEIQALLSVAEEQVKNLFQFAFYTGLRISELIGLCWDDIDWKQGVVQVRRAVVNGRLKCTKTPSSVRTVHLFQSALQALSAQKKYTFLLKKGYIFHDPWTKQPWRSSDQVRKQAWLPLFQKTDVSYRNLYQTRHTFASMMVSGGECFMWVSRQLRHETSQTTARYYVRWLPNPAIPGGYQPLNNW